MKKRLSGSIKKKYKSWKTRETREKNTRMGKKDNLRREKESEWERGDYEREIKGTMVKVKERKRKVT